MDWIVSCVVGDVKEMYSVFIMVNSGVQSVGNAWLIGMYRVRMSDFWIVMIVVPRLPVKILAIKTDSYETENFVPEIKLFGYYSRFTDTLRNFVFF